MLEPKILRCLHTFCAECTNQLVKEDRIVCPCCKSTCEYDDIKNDFKVQELIDIRIKQHQTGAGTSSQDSGFEDYPARQLQSLRHQLCSQITARNRHVEHRDVRLLGEGQYRTHTVDYRPGGNNSTETAYHDPVVARLINARDRVTSAEDYLRTCLPDGSHSSDAAAIADRMNRAVKKILFETQSLEPQRAPAPRLADEPQRAPAPRHAGDRHLVVGLYLESDGQGFDFADILYGILYGISASFGGHTSRI